MHLRDGKTLIDAISSWWTCIHGHAHPYLASKISEQLGILEHVIFAGFTHRPAMELAERLLPLLPGDFSRIFYSDNGSTAVEVALKMSRQYHVNRGKSERVRYLAFEGAYHGDTYGAMSVGERGAFTSPFSPHLFETTFLPLPVKRKEEASLTACQKELAKGDVCAFVFEPLLQGTAGMRTYGAEPLAELIRLCRSAGVLTIADEVATGFGRTGPLFAMEACGERADIICLSKALTGGVMPLGATATTEEIYRAFYSEDKLKCLFHGHSYSGNPTGCAAALASLDLLLTEACADARQRIESGHRNFAGQIRSEPGVRDIRLLGTMLAVEFDDGGQSGYFSSLRDRLYSFYLDRGVLLRPLGNVVYVLPPYCITEEELEAVYSAIRDSLRQFGRKC